MTLQLLEERCRRLIQLMEEGNTAILRRDANALTHVSAASEELLAQIEHAWYLAFGTKEVPGDQAEWTRLRDLIAEAIEQSGSNQRRVRPRSVSGDTFIRARLPHGHA